MSKIDNEIQSMLLLDHSNIVKLYKVTETDDEIFLHLELW
jgi:hypothetical protein